jgi:cytochrome c553
MPRALVPVLLLAVATGGLRPSLARAAEPVDAAFFERKVRPILAAHCQGCHDAKKEKGGLQLTSRAAALRGGDTGPAVVPGDAEKSLLVQAVRYDGELKMPPKGKLSADDIETLARWAAGGAPWPDAGATVASGPKGMDVRALAAAHWAFRPVRRPVIPPGIHPVDHFIRAKLAAAGLTQAQPADRATLLRRVTFDLLGLPPTPAEVEAFVADRSPDAWEKVVDRLLASPHYGERWGRHWLDLVRYAETQGHEFDPDIPNAWRYRDYVIRAFNTDLPYDRFVTEHVAGDLLPDPRRLDGANESVLGTGFWYLGEAKHSPVDVRQDQADRVDNMIDVFAKTFLGLTVSCARCHDHKFDPLPTKDYYALYGVLSSSRYEQAFLDDPAATNAILDELSALRGQPPAADPPHTPAAGTVLEGFAGDWRGRWFPSGPAFRPAAQRPGVGERRRRPPLADIRDSE